MLGGNSMEIFAFDAAEKLLEIELREGAPSLRALGASVWSEIVGAARGAILESRTGRLVDAHVLSESSLFVRDRSMSLLTCGRTDLPRAFDALVARVGARAIEGMRLSRERDRFPAAVRTTFEDDVAAIARTFEGETLESTRGEAVLRTFEGGSMRDALDFRVFAEGLGAEARRVFLGERAVVTSFLDGFSAAFHAELTQLHHFEPSGCSMNVVRGSDAACVHVSPEATADVVTVESSTSDARLRLALLTELEKAFQPARVSVTLDGRRLMSATEARARLGIDIHRSGDARVM
jgi:hypothetical protein